MSDFSNDKLKQLLRASAQGDRSAFKSLYEITSPRLLAVAHAMMRDAGLAEDALQDAFTQVWHRAGEYHADRGGVFTWLTTIVRYRAIDLLRKSGGDRPTGRIGYSTVDPADMDYLQRGSATDDADSKRGPLARAISSEENSLLRDCIDRLSNEQQRSVSLAFFRGFTHQELADCLAEPLGTIKSRLRRSLSRLKDCLKTLGQSNEVQRPTS